MVTSFGFRLQENELSSGISTVTLIEKFRLSGQVFWFRVVQNLKVLDFGQVLGYQRRQQRYFKGFVWKFADFNSDISYRLFNLHLPELRVLF